MWTKPVSRRTNSWIRAYSVIKRLLIISINCEIALKEVPLTPGSEAVSIIAIPVYPITTGSARMQYCQVREAEEPLENNIRGPYER